MSAPIPQAGELAALGTAMCWTVSSLAFEAAGKRIGSIALNFIRLLLAFLILVVINSVRRGLPLPTDATSDAWFWLTLSGLAGFTLGDMFLFEAFVLVGSRISMLMMALVPPITAVIGWAVMGERLSRQDVVGMALTVGGVAWVVLERKRSATGEWIRLPAFGLLFGFGGAAGQATGLVLSKLGMGGYDAFASNQVRMIAGLAGLTVVYSFAGWWPRTVRAFGDRPGVSRAGLGAIFGPFLGVTLSLVAVKHTEAGVAATLMALVPVFILVPTALMRKERVTLRAASGAVVAVAGAALLFL